MSSEQEESINFYKSLAISPSGISKDKISHTANPDMNDCELVAFYSERYVDVDVAEFLTREREERLYGLCNLVKPGEFYLDVGCANGAHMDLLRSRNINGIGVDLSVPNILRGRHKYPNLKFIHGFAEDLPFMDDYFDIALLGDVIEHFRNPKVTIAECLRVVKKGLAICVPIKPEITPEHINPFSYDSILELLNFYKLKFEFFDPHGQKISDEEAKSKLTTFPWLLIRAEKTPRTDNVLKEIATTEGKRADRKVADEILENDQWSHDTEHNRHETEVARFGLLSHLIEGQKVLEPGCGNGDLSIEVAKRGFDVTGLDISKAGIRQAIQQRKTDNLDTNTEFLVGDGTRLPFPDSSFDSILLAEVLKHVRSSKKLLDEAIRVVRNGGRIIISVPDGLLIPWPGHLRIFLKDTLETELSQYSEEIEWHTLPFKKWLICSFFVQKSDSDIAEGPLVDVIMPTYNGRKSIKRAINSILNQTYRNWNLIVINDGGEDVKDIIDEFHDNRIKYIISEHKGKSHALNVGIKSSSGEFISYLDDDDILYPIHLETLIKAAMREGSDFVYDDWYEVSLDEDGREARREFEFRQDVTSTMLAFQNYINHKCILHSRPLLEKTGMYDEELEVLIDWDMIRRLSFVCELHHVWCVTSERLRYYKQGSLENRITSLWETNPDRARKSLERILKKTTELPATEQQLKEIIERSMSYYHNLEISPVSRELQKQIAEKEQRISTLTIQIQESLNRARAMEQSVVERDSQVASMTDQLQEASNNAMLMEQALAERESNIALISGKLQEVSDRARVLEQFATELQDKAIRTQELEQEVSEYCKRISSLNAEIQESTTQNQTFGQAVTERENQIISLNKQIHEVTEQAKAVEREIDAIRQSVVWQTVMMFHCGFVNRFLPHGSRRRNAYDLSLRRCRTLVNGDDRSFSDNDRSYSNNDNKNPNISLKDGYQLWIEKNEPNKEELKMLKKNADGFGYRPKISIVTPVWNIDEKWLRAAIDSAFDQVYDNWELCIADGASEKKHIKKVMREYADKDSRIKIKFLSANKGISGNSNEALSMASGEFILLLDHDDELSPFALFEIVKLLNDRPDLDFIYSDEDKIDESGLRKDPFFKPDWSPDMFLSCNYIIHISAIRKSLVDKVRGFREGYDGSQDYDLFLRVLEFIKEENIAHIPKILYHWRTIPSSAASSDNVKPYAYTAAKKALKDSMNRRGIEIEDVLDGFWPASYRIKRKIKGNPEVTIIIPTKDKMEILKTCIDSIINKTTYKNYKILLVDNQSTEDKTINYYDELKNNSKIRIIEYDKPFNYSAINNFAVSQCDSEYILFLNNDIEVISDEWLAAMLEQAQREEVGAVGAKLFFPNNSIQHCGVTLSFETASHPYHKCPDQHGYFGMTNAIRNCSAVTAACMLTKKSVFLSSAGFDENNLTVAFNDVDYCLKLRQKDYLIVYTPYSRLYHHESVSRGDNDNMQPRYLREIAYMREKWGRVIDSGDIYLNPNLMLSIEDFLIKIKS